MKKLLVVLTSIFLSCYGPQTPIEKAGWLIGTWQGTSENGTITESWEQKNDSLFVGVDYLINEKDTFYTEHIELRQRGADLYYIPTVTDQNEGKPVEFKLSSSEGKLVFENPTHDFPQFIIYTQQGKDSLLAEVSGKENGVPRSEKFWLKRIN